MQLMTKPKDFQEDGVRMIEGFADKALLADDMGLGKTFQALYWLARNTRPRWPALVVCPASVKYNWRNEAYDHFRIASTVIEGHAPDRIGGIFNPSTPPITIINYDLLQSWAPALRAMKFKSVIYDEVHAFQNSESIRTTVATDFSHTIPGRLGLSGTPLTNRPADLWPILNILNPSIYPSWDVYAQRYTFPRLTRYGWTFEGGRNLDELNATLLRTIMIRRRKSILKLPGKFRHIRMVEMLDPGEYYEASNNFLHWLGKQFAGKARSRVTKAKKAEKLVKVGYLLRLAAKQKLYGTIQQINGWLDANPTEKAIVFANHTPMLDALGRRLNARSVIVDGSVAAKTRDEYKHKFQTDPNTRLFIGNLRACGTGLNLTAAANVIMTELPWTPAALTQGEDRAYRLGQTRPVQVHYMIAKGTIEERICDTLQTKQDHVQSVLDGDYDNIDLDLRDLLLKGLV